MSYFQLKTLLAILAITILATAASNDHRHLRSVLGALLDPNIPQVQTQRSGTTCTGCSRRYQTETAPDPEDISDENVLKEIDESSITEQELTALRIEYIKNQILTKLRLKEKPSSIAKLPQLVEEDSLYAKQTALDINETVYRQVYSDGFYGKTIEAIILPYEDEAKCVRKIRNPSACVPFQMPNDIAASDVSSVELWFHKEPDVLDTHNQTFVVSEVVHWDSNKSFQKNKPIAILESNLNEGWIKVDVTSVIKNWLMYQDSPIHAIAVACKTCGMDMQKSPISFRPSFKPFLTIRTYSPQQQAPVMRRHKRMVNDCATSSNECCRESLYISFAEIEWDDWIIEPKGFNAYYCKGSCSTAASLTVHPTDYNNILRKVMFSRNRNNKPQRIELKPCCAATRYSPLELIYTNNTKTIFKKSIPNMIIESCGCK